MGGLPGCSLSALWLQNGCVRILEMPRRSRDNHDAVAETDRFEYTTEVMTHGFMGVHKGEIKRTELVNLLNEKGAEGWDLVHAWFDQKLQGEKDGHLLIFRRPL
jgi:hypothetical protein